jgi:RHS repeat-associated protein
MWKTTKKPSTFTRFFSRFPCCGQLDGQIAGQMWSTMGDDAQRKYEYTYDNAGRLINAAFNQQQHPGDGWSNSTMDFSVSGTSGQITYDNNGNLLTMLQKGVVPGQSAPLTIDDLRYAYNSYSNKLSSVTDMMTSTNFNGISGDFVDGTNAAGTPDYVYDNNGNVVMDLNRNLQSLNNGAAGTAGVHYNYLDKPDQIRIPGKGTVLIVYDAEGQKLQRAFVPDAGGSGLVTTYINQFVYQETATLTTSSLPPFSGASPHLAYINFEEGRIRAMKDTATNNGYDGMSESGNLTLPTAPGGGYNSGAWDYFILDYQQNVRMILTEETHSATNECTMELTNNRPAAEDPVFGQTGSANEVETTRQPTPAAWTGNTSASVSELGNLAGHTLGPNSLQKVMAGDMITASVLSYYAGTSTSSNPNIVTNLLANLTSLIGNGPAAAGTLVHGAAPNVTNNLNNVTGFANAVEPYSYTNGTPQAYLTILFFDERFNFIMAADGGVAQAQVRTTDAGNPNALPLILKSIQAPRNGYAYIYISNRSDQPVYFDNLTINVTTGNIAEEDHYYAYGLKIAAISSKKLGDVGEGNLANNFQYQGGVAETDADIGWQDFDLREYDAQIGRWEQQDPYDQFASPYVGMAADPINGVDPDGGLTFYFATLGDLTGSILLDRLVIAGIGAGVGYTVDHMAGGNGWAGAGVGAVVAFGASFIPVFSINVLFGKSTAIESGVGISVMKSADEVVKGREVTVANIPTTRPNINIGSPSQAPDLKLPPGIPPTNDNSSQPKLTKTAPEKPATVTPSANSSNTTRARTNTANDDAATLARQIIQSGRVTFGSTHPAPPNPADRNDAANADDNIRDAANGMPAHTSFYGPAKGKVVRIDPRILRILDQLSREYVLVISEITGGAHSANSRHYAGLAIDITSINGIPVTKNNPLFRQLMERARELGATEVIGPGSKGHDTHVHVAVPRN